MLLLFLTNDFFDAVIDIECVYANNLESTKIIKKYIGY